jgi:type VI secretion system protein ImpF
MATRPSNLVYQHSIWDRLLDDRHLATEQAEATGFKELNRLKGEVRRDLEWLLNTRRSLPARVNSPKAPSDSARPSSDSLGRLSHLEHSLINYGLDDLTALNLADPAERERLRRLLERAIALFEPRLQNVKVSYTGEALTAAAKTIHFLVQADLKVEPAPERVVFKTDLELGSNAFAVAGEGS